VLNRREILFDETRWPIAVVTVPHAALVPDEYSPYFDRLRAFYERGQRFAIVIDIRGAAEQTAEERRTIAERHDRYAEQYGGLLACVALILSSRVQRASMAVMSWLMRRPAPARGFADVEAGVAWAQKVLAGRGESSPPVSKTA
jgi:hypothetical protein